MHTNRFFPARKFLLGAAAGLALLGFSGCASMVLTDLTPPSIPENPSQIYTFTLRATPKVTTIVNNSVKPQLIVDGQTFDMKKSTLGADLYEFEYPLANLHDDLNYYYLVGYKVEGNSIQSPREAYTQLAHTKIVRRYVLSLETNRGPVGSRISVLGRGFTPQDVVLFEGVQAQTEFKSPTSLTFVVPPVPSGKNYKVVVSGSNGISSTYAFRVDSSNVSVSPSSLTLRTGEQQTLVFTLQNPAPAGGTALDVTTDVPECVIMPEVVVPPGQTSVSIPVTGGRAGNCTLFLKGYGSGEISVPVTVSGK